VAAVSALIFLVCVAIVSFVPVPFVAWSPGSTYDLLSVQGGRPLIDVAGVGVHPTTGQLRLTTVGVTPVDARVNLVEALAAYWMSSRDALPREAVYPPQLDAQTVRNQESAQMDSSQSGAVVAALRQAGMPVSELPMVVSVVASGPSANYLQAGDLVTKIDDTDVQTVDAVRLAIVRRHVGDQVVVTFLRDGQESHATMTTAATSAQPDVPSIGVTLGMGYTYEPRVSFNVDPAIGGPSGGLMFSLAIYDKLSGDDLAAGRIIAGTGTIDAQGTVGAIGGVQEKIAAAAQDHATIFLLPAANCPDVIRPTDIQLVPVTTLDEAVRALQTPGAPSSVAGCR